MLSTSSTNGCSSAQPITKKASFRICAVGRCFGEARSGLRTRSRVPTNCTISNSVKPARGNPPQAILLLRRRRTRRSFLSRRHSLPSRFSSRILRRKRNVPTWLRRRVLGIPVSRIANPRRIRRSRVSIFLCYVRIGCRIFAAFDHRRTPSNRRVSSYKTFHSERPVKPIRRRFHARTTFRHWNHNYPYRVIVHSHKLSRRTLDVTGEKTADVTTESFLH